MDQTGILAVYGHAGFYLCQPRQCVHGLREFDTTNAETLGACLPVEYVVHRRADMYCWHANIFCPWRADVKRPDGQFPRGYTHDDLCAFMSRLRPPDDVGLHAASWAQVLALTHHAIAAVPPPGT